MRHALERAEDGGAVYRRLHVIADERFELEELWTLEALQGGAIGISRRDHLGRLFHEETDRVAQFVYVLLVHAFSSIANFA
jgi:hypothetical protein